MVPRMHSLPRVCTLVLLICHCKDCNEFCLIVGCVQESVHCKTNNWHHLWRSLCGGKAHTSHHLYRNYNDCLKLLSYFSVFLFGLFDAYPSFTCFYECGFMLFFVSAWLRWSNFWPIRTSNNFWMALWKHPITLSPSLFLIMSIMDH